jgi:Skp family chaperone for outer membrane proteins
MLWFVSTWVSPWLRKSKIKSSRFSLTSAPVSELPAFAVEPARNKGASFQEVVMRKMTMGFGVLPLLVVLLVGVMTPFVACSESLSVGFVDLERIRQEFKAYQNALEEIKGIRDKEQVALDEMAGTFDSKVKRYELKDGLWPSEEEKTKELELLRRDWQMINEHKVEKDRKLEMDSREKLEPLITRIKEGIETVSKSKGKHLVFKKSDLAYSDPRLDITDSVLQYLNEE